MSHCLSDDLLAEIFERLPVKFLVRFRSLSKSWRSRIASPEFIHAYYLRSINASSRQKVLIRHIDYSGHDSYALHPLDKFALCRGHGSVDTSTLDLPFDSPKFINSCNGILCLVECGWRVMIWNPSIRRKVVLPEHPCSKDVERPFVAVGLGLDPVTNDYKIVSISDLRCQGSVKTSFVYSLATNAWSPIASPTTPLQNIRSSACCVNGALHWVAYSYIPYSIDQYIMTFDLSTHVFGKIRLPEPSWTTTKPTTVDGCLAVISYEADYNCRVWVMKEYNNDASWSVRFKLQTLSPDDDGDLKKVLQLATNRHFLLNTYLAGLKVYNVDTGVHFRLFEQIYYKVYMEMCLESLELLDRGEVLC